MKQIISRDNQKVKYASKLKNRNFRNREGKFLVEGPKILEEALKHEGLVQQVFIDISLAEEYEDLYAVHDELEWYAADSRLIKQMSDTETPQGIVAVAKQPCWPWDRLMERNGFLVLLDQIADPGNLGTIIRTGWALGVDGILLTKECVDPFNPKVVRATMGGIFNLPLYPNVSEEKLGSLKDAGYQLMCTSLEAESSFYSLDFTGRILVVIGSESRGVSENIKSICSSYFKIPINPAVDSLNAAVACAIIMHEAWKQQQGFTLF